MLLVCCRHLVSISVEGESGHPRKGRLTFGSARTEDLAGIAEKSKCLMSSIHRINPYSFGVNTRLAPVCSFNAFNLARSVPIRIGQGRHVHNSLATLNSGDGCGDGGSNRDSESPFFDHALMLP